MPSSNSTLSMIILGGFSLLSISFLAYYFFGFGSGPKLLKNETIARAPIGKDGDKLNPNSKKHSPEVSAVTVEDVNDDGESSDEEDEEDNDDEGNDTENEDTSASSAANASANAAEREEAAAREKEAKEKREAYDAATGMASKLIKGNHFGKAIEKLSEALELATSVPSASKDILSLYNNRSAMYEKTQEYEKSLRDITVVLMMDPFHLKARTRRGRVYEAQNKLVEAVNDFVYVMLLERAKGEAPTFEKKLEDLCRSIATVRAAEVIATIRSSSERILPPKSYCRSVFELFPAFHRSRIEFKSVSQSDLEQQWADVLASDAATDAGSVSAKASAVSTLLTLVRFHLTQDRFTLAFELLGRSAAYVTEAVEAQLAPAVKALRLNLMGTEMLLRRNLAGAREYLERAQSLQFDLDAALKILSIQLELGEYAEVEQGFKQLLEAEDANDVAVAWILLHRSTLWLTRVESQYRPDAIELAMADVDAALARTFGKRDGDIDAVRFTLLLKVVHVLTQSKNQLGLPTTDEDQIRGQAHLEEAKRLFPLHESVILLDAELMTSRGEFTEALALIDSPGVSARMDPVARIMVRGAVYTSKAFSDMQNPMNGQLEMAAAQGMLGEVETMYQQALLIEPQSIEVMAQLAQMKSMIAGDFESAVNLLTRAIPLARSRDEVQELYQLLLMNDAQWKAVQELQKISPGGN